MKKVNKTKKNVEGNMTYKSSQKLTRKTLKHEQSQCEKLLNTFPKSLMEKYPSSVLIKKIQLSHKAPCLTC